MRPKIRGIDITFISGGNRLVWFFRPSKDGEVDRDPRNHQQPSVSSVLRAQRAQVALMQRMGANEEHHDPD